MKPAVRPRQAESLEELRRLDGKVSFDVFMNRHTTMRVGGPAMALYQPGSIDAVVESIRFFKRNGLPFLVIGGGSNMIVKDKGANSIFIKLSSPCFKGVEVSDKEITCGAGVLLRELIKSAEDESLGGMEFLVGIPGTVGGAIAQNAGAHGYSISDILRRVKVIDRAGEVITLSRQDIKSGYRSSGLDGYVIVAATFALYRKDRRSIRDAVMNNLQSRLINQDYSGPSSGCIFKNPAGMNISAGELIDRCGLKGNRIGGAWVSQKHANFIMNKKRATAADILELIDIIKKKVKDRFDVELKEEVKIIG